MHLRTTGLFINHKSCKLWIRLKNEFTNEWINFLDLSKNANHSLTQSLNHKIGHLPKEYISYTFKNSKVSVVFLIFLNFLTNLNDVLKNMQNSFLTLEKFVRVLHKIKFGIHCRICWTAYSYVLNFYLPKFCFMF